MKLYEVQNNETASPAPVPGRVRPEQAQTDRAPDHAAAASWAAGVRAAGGARVRSRAPHHPSLPTSKLSGALRPVRPVQCEIGCGMRPPRT